jgi:RNA polymerase sigma-70 factor (ECF subfamily)
MSGVVCDVAVPRDSRAGVLLPGGVTDIAVAHDELRPRMFSIAYRMLGSVAEAEDVVQEAFLRILESSRRGRAPDSPGAFATTVTTRLAIDALRSARRRREHYVGTWLPEPLLGDDADPAHQVELDETVSIAFLAVLERLSPVERAVFLLREVFGYDYAEIASVVGKSEPNCRQLLARARRRIDEARPRFEESPQRRADLASRFFAAVQAGDVTGLERLLAEDAALYADGGGKTPAIRRPLRGVTRVARFLAGIGRAATRANVRMAPAQANGQPAIRLLDADGALLGVVSVDVVDGRVAAVHNQINPDKLGHLGRVGNLAALIRPTTSD